MNDEGKLGVGGGGHTKSALNPKKKLPFKLKEKLMLSHNTRLFRFALQSPEHRLGLPIGQHMFFYAKVSPLTSDTDATCKQTCELGLFALHGASVTSSNQSILLVGNMCIITQTCLRWVWAKAQKSQQDLAHVGGQVPLLLLLLLWEPDGLCLSFYFPLPSRSQTCPSSSPSFYSCLLPPAPSRTSALPALTFARMVQDKGEMVMRAYTPTSCDDDVGYFDLVVKVYFANDNPAFPLVGTCLWQRQILHGLVCRSNKKEAGLDALCTYNMHAEVHDLHRVAHQAQKHDKTAVSIVPVI